MKKQINAEILSVGTELLLGDIVNTNAQFLSKRLADFGINVFYQTTVGDNPERLLNALETAFSRANMVITTGGLGPTGDDLTKETIAQFFNRPLEYDEESAKELSSYFKNRAMTKNNEKQVYFPKGSHILPNKNGTAPGFMIDETDGRIIVVLPGPPSEMRPMFEDSVTPFLRTLSDFSLFSVTLRFGAIGESNVEDTLKDLMDNGTNPTVAPYAKQDGVIVRLTAKARNVDEANALTNPVKNEIYQRLGKHIISESAGGEPPAINVLTVEKLIAQSLTISTAESCTGGLLAAAFVDVSGASKTFLDGVVSYDNNSKIYRLGVRSETLEKFGAVSPETALQMAEGVTKALKTDIGISTTGVAGPDGGTPEKPVGLIYVGLCIKGGTSVRELRLPSYSRTKIRQRTVREALEFLYSQI